jgi:hypothetical protein
MPAVGLWPARIVELEVYSLGLYLRLFVRAEITKALLPD